MVNNNKAEGKEADQIIKSLKKMEKVDVSKKSKNSNNEKDSDVIGVSRNELINKLKGS